MFDVVINVFRNHPEVAIFLSIAIGTLIGRIKLGPFHLGAVAGSLLAGLVIGQLDIAIPALLKSVFFALFIYSVGFKSGPAFFESLNRGTIKLVILSVVLCVTGLACILIMNEVFHFDAGFAAGIGAGALTDTAMMGTASSAMQTLDISKEALDVLNSHMAIAYAVTYVFGTVGLIVFVGTVAPVLLRINLKESAREFEAQLMDGEGSIGSSTSEDDVNVYSMMVFRSHQVMPDAPVVGLTVEQVEEQLPYLSIERVIRNDEIHEREPGLILNEGDVVGLAARRSKATNLEFKIGPEVDSAIALSYPQKSVVMVLNKKEYEGLSLKEIRTNLGQVSDHGVFVSRMTRGEYELPLSKHLIYTRGDVVELIGRADQVENIANQFGRIKKSRHKSDIALHTFAIAIGTMVGLLSTHIGAIPIELGVGGGILIVALIAGWLHTRYPNLGDLPPAAQWAFSELGLTAFAAIVGLMAGPRAIVAMQEHGWSLLGAGVFVTLVPPIVALYVGRYILKLHPLILLGGIAGSQTEAASMSAVIEESGSQAPVIGFTVCYAVSNILFAVWGPIIVALS